MKRTSRPIRTTPFAPPSCPLSSVIALGHRGRNSFFPFLTLFLARFVSRAFLALCIPFSLSFSPAFLATDRKVAAARGSCRIRIWLMQSRMLRSHSPRLLCHVISLLTFTPYTFFFSVPTASRRGEGQGREVPLWETFCRKYICAFCWKMQSVAKGTKFKCLHRMIILSGR